MADDRIIIDIDDLIRIMRTRTCLWDQGDPHYCKRDYQRVAWMEVADELQAPVNELKKRWRGLRDTFTRELRKVDLTNTKTDAELVEGVSWRYFSLLLFLRNVIAPPQKARRKRALTIELSGDENELGDAEDMHTSDRSGSPDVQVKQEDPLTPMVVHTFKQEDLPVTGDVTNHLDVDAAVTSVTSDWDEEWKVDTMDADAQFLMSLLPFLQDVPKNRKLLVRARLTDVLMQEQNARKYN